MGFVDGIQKRRKPKQDADQWVWREPIFSESNISPKTDEKYGEVFCDTIEEQNETKEINFSTRKKLSNHLNKNLLKYSFKSGISIFLIAIIVLFGLYKIESVKAKADALSNEASNHIEISFKKIEEGDLAGAMTEANLAKEKIVEMKLAAQSYGQDVQYFKYMPFKSSRLAANERMLDASYDIIRTFSDLNDVLSFSGGVTLSHDYIIDLSVISEDLSRFIEKSHDKLTQSKSDLERAKKSLEAKDQKKVESAIEAIEKGIDSTDFTKALCENHLAWLSGEDGQPKKLLILFQNNAELRGGSGGSLGSFGIASLSEGKLKKIDFGKNIYKIDKPFAAKTHIEPPEIIKFLNPDWVMKDSGWAVDGPEANRKIIEFYQKETGETVQGVVMIDTSAVISLLKVVGPIEMSDYGKKITAENFRSEMENEVHEIYFDNPENLIENEPKKIIGDMIPILMQKILENLSNDNSGKILASLSQSTSSKDITFYFENEIFENDIEKYNLAGSVEKAIGDYLYVNNSNIAGEKSSLSIEETINLNIEIKKDGKIENNINLVRDHKGNDIKPDGYNKNFVRLLLPEDSKVNNFSGVSGNYEQAGDQGFRQEKPYWIGKEAGKSVINFWMNTKPGEKSELNIAYEPNYTISTKDDFTYNLTVQKQPGANPDDLIINLKYPEGFEPENVESFDTKNRLITIPYLLSKDKTFKFRFKKN